jgi:hypothetical protein
MIELLRKTGERIRSILRRRARSLEILRGQAGACMTAPHTLHVRRDKLE